MFNKTFAPFRPNIFEKSLTWEDWILNVRPKDVLFKFRAFSTLTWLWASTSNYQTCNAAFHGCASSKLPTERWVDWNLLWFKISKSSPTRVERKPKATRTWLLTPNSTGSCGNLPSQQCSALWLLCTLPLVSTTAKLRPECLSSLCLRGSDKRHTICVGWQIRNYTNPDRSDHAWNIILILLLICLA